MEDFFKIRAVVFCNCILASTLVLLSLFIISPNLEACETCDQISKEEALECESIVLDVSELGDLAETFAVFQKMYEDDSLVPREFFLKRWCKKAKRWFLKRVYFLIKEVVQLKGSKKSYTKEYGAYMVAKFSRDIGKYCNTGKMRKHINEAKKEWKNDPNINRVMDPFLNTILHFSKNKHQRAKHPDWDRYDYMVPRKYDPDKDYLEGVPLKSAFGTIEIVCGGLITLIPIPGCVWVGNRLMIHGGSMVIAGYYEEYFEEKPKGFALLGNDLTAQRKFIFVKGIAKIS